MATPNQDNPGCSNRVTSWFRTLWESLATKIDNAALEAKRLGKEDPRRMIHAAKVGLAIALVSIVYYFDPIYEGFGVSAMWAVMTVIVVFEFSVGATLGKGVNRAIATFLGGTLGVGAHRLASFPGIEILEPILLGLFAFIIAGVVTFMRFFPQLKARYDYGLLIFILTFCLISVSGYRDDQVLDMAFKRVSTILIGGSLTFAVCVVIFPVWAGKDLHDLVADNVDKLGTFLQGFGGKLFANSADDEDSEDKETKVEEYRSVFNSKSIEDSLVNFAKWEPRHGKFRYRQPWGHYLKIGSLTRECAYRLDSLNCYLKYEIKTSQDIRAIFEESCTQMSTECSNVLKKSALAISTMTKPPVVDPHILKAMAAADNINRLLKTDPCKDVDLQELIHVAGAASVLKDVVLCTEKIAECVGELATLSKFKDFDPQQKNEQINGRGMMRSSSIQGSHNIVIALE